MSGSPTFDTEKKEKTKRSEFITPHALRASGVIRACHMGRSYLGYRKNISIGQIILFCSYGEMFSCLPGKVSRCDVDFVKCKQKFFPLSGKVVFI